MLEYRPRVADKILARKLEGKGAVLIEGPKWCGKTTTAEQVAGSILYMDYGSREMKQHRKMDQAFAQAANLLLDKIYLKQQFVL